MSKMSVKINILWAVSVLVLLLIFLNWMGLFGWFNNFIYQISSPFTESFYQAGISIQDKYQQSTSEEDLSELVEEQKNQIMQLEADRARLHDVERDNQSLREYLKLYEEQKYDYIMAQVISRDVISHDAISHNKLIINRGEKHGVKIGLIVINQYGVAVGKVTAVKADLAEISLLNSPDCRLAVSVQNSDQTIGLSQGELGLTVKLEFAPQSQKISIGDVVVSSGLEPNVPSGIVVAKVKSIDTSVNEIWQKITLEPVANLTNLRWLSVLLPRGSFIME